MLRTIVLALAVAAPSLAGAEQFPQSALHAEVRADDGTVVGRIEAVERNAEGRIVAVEIAGAEPADAPYAPEALVAEAPRAHLAEIVERHTAERGREAGLLIN